ncbi:PadR family transcriptional regulator [Saccharothrix obliqua]|uniref:PadR family transcriptional regulator n=1 Tax=Saccharothrix obliqua TaxID=2861747 RepID=UPI001C5F1224|nr:PadR family transcriptional regulator [Saccharothrix obliqua]MBW4721977.1 PadR family transcriptional regulator [Saccharothrix obliqua]
MPSDASHNSLVLPLLGLLVEQPAHAYDLTGRLNERYGHLTATRSTVTSLLKTLERNGFLVARTPESVGNRPPRTTYELTEQGVADFRARVETGVARALPASVDFTLAVSYLGVVPAARAEEVLRARAERLTGELADLVLPAHVPEVHMLEVPYWRSIVTTEIAWLRESADRIRTGDLDWGAR